MNRLTKGMIFVVMAAWLALPAAVQAQDEEWPYLDVAEDAEINDGGPSTPETDAALIDIGLSYGVRQRGLIRFPDIADFVAANIPAGEDITKVTMRLRSPVRWGPTDHVFKIETYRMLKPWNEDEDTGPTWDNQIDEEVDGQGTTITPSVEWAEPGLGAGTDRAADPTYVFEVTAAEMSEDPYYGWMLFDVTSDVLGFLDGTYDNYGWLLQDTFSEETVPDVANGVKSRFHTSDEPLMWDRVPQLEFEYGNAGPVLDLNGDGTVDSADIDYLMANLEDRDSDGDADQQDVEYFVAMELGSCMGDTDLNGSVDEADLAWVADGWKIAGSYDWATGDFTGDGQINEADLAYLADNWKQPCGPASSVPEPATLACLGAGAAMLVRRKR